MYPQMKPNDILWIAVLVFITNCQQQAPINAEVWPEITKEMKPWTRWWWMGNAVNEPEIERQLKDLAEAGFGGIEITPIYGVQGFEDQYIDFLSDEWMDVLEFTITKADELGMGVDMNLGTGWPFGGPQITPELAASKLIMQKYELKSGSKLMEKIQINDPKQNPDDVELLALMAYFDAGKPIDISVNLDENMMLQWTPESDVEIVAAFNGKTRQKVKRAAPGGEGWSMDHFSKEALEVYLSRFDSAFSKITHRPRSFFNDSFEVYGSSGTRDIFQAFKERKGYDLRYYLRELMSEDDIEVVRRVKSDYREVFGDLLMEEFTVPWKEWSNNQGVLARNQAHGSPANIIDLYGAVDIPECETFGSSFFPIPGLRRESADVRNVDPDPVMMKFATSAANVLGKDYVSSETFTWLAEHFKVSLSQCKPELEQVWLAGVNHVFYHGTTYSPEEGGWPGWLFYASVQFGPVNSFWPHVIGLNEYIARTQSILQGGNADNDVLVYWPIYDVWDDAGRLDKQVSIHNIDEWLHPTSFYKLSKALLKDGYLIDFATDDIIEAMFLDNDMIQADPEGGKYKTLIIPAGRYMSLETLNIIINLASQGATIIFEDLPKDVPGFHDLENRRDTFKNALEAINLKDGLAKVGNGWIYQAGNVSEKLSELNIQGETLVETGLKFVRRIIDGDRYYYLVNHTPNSVDQELTLNTDAKAVMLMDPDHEQVGYVIPQKEGGKALVRVQLDPGQSIIIRCTDRDVSQLPAWKYASKPRETIALDGNWKLSFTSGGPELPNDAELSELTSWTSLNDEKAVNFSGTGVYEYTLSLEGELADEYILDLGKVAESAGVWINDQEVDVLWSIPFKMSIGKYLKTGTNKFRIEVANLMANRIRYMDQQGLEWRKFHEINFVNIDYEPFDASGWEPMSSGLLGPVVLNAVDLE
jgi:hypothetical protein